MEMDKKVFIHMPLFAELFDALPPELQTDRVQEALLRAYRQELHCLINAALHPDCQEPRLVMRPWRLAGTQWIVEFWVADAGLPWTPATNFHMQNTSQWRYRGAIVLQGEEVSTHH